MRITDKGSGSKNKKRAYLWSQCPRRLGGNGQTVMRTCNGLSLIVECRQWTSRSVLITRSAISPGTASKNVQGQALAVVVKGAQVGANLELKQRLRGGSVSSQKCDLWNVIFERKQLLFRAISHVPLHWTDVLHPLVLNECDSGQ